MEEDEPNVVQLPQPPPRTLFEELRPLFEHPAFSEDRYLQAEAIVLLRSAWDQLTSHEKRESLKWAPLLTRCRATGIADPEAVLLRIIKLPAEEDVRRALQVSIGLKDYIWSDEERVYLEVGGFLGRYLNYAKGNYVPLGFHFWSGVALLGAVCQRKVYFDAGQFPILPNWYVFLVGDPSTGKSAAARAAVDIIRRLNRQLCPLTENLTLTEEQRLAALGPVGRQLVNVIPGDNNIPSIIKFLNNLYYNPTQVKPDGTVVYGLRQPVDSTGFMFIDELASFLGKGTFDVAQKPAFLAAIKDADFYDKSTIYQGTQPLRNLAVTVLACCAPGWLKDAIDPTTLGGGLADRTTYVFRAPVWQRKAASSPFKTMENPRDPVVAEALAEDLRRVVELPTKKTVTVSEGARTVGEYYYRLLVEGERLRYQEIGNSDDQTSSSRAANDFIRLGMLLALSDSLYHNTFPRIEIDEHQIDLAYRLTTAEETSLREFLERSQHTSKEPAEGRLRRKIRERDRCYTRSEVTKDLMHGHKVSAFIPAAKQLIEEDILEVGYVGRYQRWRAKGHECEKCKGLKVLDAAYQLRA